MSTRQRLRDFLATHKGGTSAAWRRQLADRARQGAAWPNPWDIATSLGLRVRVLRVEGIRYGTNENEVVIGYHVDSRVMCHRLATAIAQHLLELSNARWATSDAYMLAFELLMPTESVARTPPDRLASCQPNAVPALVETWGEYVRRSAKSA
jgi:hypothetical protein